MSEPTIDSAAEPYMEALNELLVGLQEFVGAFQKQADSESLLTDDEKRAAFMADHAELIGRASTLVVIAPGTDGKPPECRTFSLPEVCHYVQALTLREIASRIAAKHPPYSCK